MSNNSDEATSALNASRKDEHVAFALEQREASPRNAFDDIEFLHHALGAVSDSDVSIATEVFGSTWSMPFYINGMTGGSEKTDRLNRELAIAARETSIAMASGSVSIALNDPSREAGFRVLREENPDGFLFANIGAGRNAEDARRAVDLLEANALQLHLNAAQETVMPEGSREFSSWLRLVEEIVRASTVPVIVKEVGFGLSRRTLETLRDIGVVYADVSGSGGTNFARIEGARRDDSDFGWLNGYGQSTVECLLDAPVSSPTLVASGGIRNPLDVAKSLALGARAVGVAGTFLQAVHSGGAESLVHLITTWRTGLTRVLALLGATNPDAMTSTDVIVRGRSAEFARSRGIDITPLSARSSHAATSTSGGHNG